MSRYIDADLFLKDESKAYMATQLKIKDEQLKLVNKAVHAKIQMLIADAPTVDVAPVRHGRWLNGKGGNAKIDDYGYVCDAYCSECGNWLTASDEYGCDSNYCPNCGAKMDKISDNP